MIDDYARPEALLVMPAEAEGVSVTLGFEYYDNGYDTAVTYLSPKRIIQPHLRTDNSGGGRVANRPDKNQFALHALTFQQFMKSF